jgi:hypothetical protein
MVDDGFNTKFGSVVKIDNWSKGEAQMCLEDAIIKHKRRYPDSDITLDSLRKVDQGVPPENVVVAFFGGLDAVVNDITSKLREPTSSKPAPVRQSDVVSQLFPGMEDQPSSIDYDSRGPTGTRSAEEPVKYDYSLESNDGHVMDVSDDSIMPLEEVPDGQSSVPAVEEIIELDPEDDIFADSVVPLEEMKSGDFSIPEHSREEPTQPETRAPIDLYPTQPDPVQSIEASISDALNAPDLPDDFPEEDDVSMVPRDGPKVKLDNSLSNGTAVVSNGNGKRAPKTGTVVIDRKQLDENPEESAVKYMSPGEPVSGDGDSDKMKDFDEILGGAPSGKYYPENSAAGMEFYSGGGAGGYGGSGDESGMSRGKKVGIFATIVALAVAGFFGLNALLNKGCAENVHKKQESQFVKQEEQKKPEFDAVAWEQGCKAAAAQRVLQLVGEDHPVSLNHNYNLSPDGKVVISNQGVINMAYWFGTRADEDRSNDYRGGFGKPGQGEMADGLLSDLGLSVDKLAENRGDEFDEGLIETTMVNSSVVPECKVPAEAQEGGDVVKDPVPDEKAEGADDDGKGAFNIHDGYRQDDKLGNSDPALQPLHTEDDELDIDIYVDEQAFKEADDIPVVPITAGPDLAKDDLESIAEMYAQAKFDKGSGFRVEDIQMFYKGVTPELAREIYLDQKLNEADYEDDGIIFEEPVMADPVTEAEYLIEKARKELADRFDALSRSYIERFDILSEKIEAVKKDLAAAEAENPGLYAGSVRDAA